MKKILFYASAVAVLFSSCSKDAIEEVATIEAGNKVFTASINVEDDATTRLALNGTAYAWEVNDAMGVATAAHPDANIPVINTVAGAKPSFSVSTEDWERWLDNVKETDDDNHMYLYFPYMQNTSFDVNEDGVASINLEIPTVQRYAEGSFYRNTVPAVGFTKEYTGADQEMSLKAPVALLQVAFAGFGDANSISLKIKTNDGTYAKLSGTSSVQVTPEWDTTAKDYKEFAPEFTISSDSNNAKDYVTVEFGNKAAQFAYNNQLKVHFVIPAGINLSEAELEFMLNYDGSDWKADQTHKMGKANSYNTNNTYKTKANTRTNLGNAETGWSVVKFRLDDKILISTEEEFLAYAYLTRPNVANLDFTDKANVADYAYAAEYLGASLNEVAAIEALIIADELDFADFGKAWADAKLAAIEEEDLESASGNFWHNLLIWYKNNNYSIESLSYNGVHGSSNTTIKNLNVVGSGLTAGASLSNLTLQNVTVNAGIFGTKDGKVLYDDKAGNYVALIAAENSLTSKAYGGSDETMLIKNVTIGTGNVVNGGQNTTFIGGIYAVVNENTDNLIATASPIEINVAGTEQGTAKDYAPYVGRLYAAAQKSLTLTLENKYTWSETQAAYPVIGFAKNANITADKAQSTTAKNAGVVGLVGDASYVLVEGVSYWNGYKVENNDVAPFTAEELAWALQHNAARNITLTNAIDMQCNDVTKFAVTVNHAATKIAVTSSVKAAAWTAENPVYEQVEIKNMKANVYQNSSIASIFGNDVTIQDVKLSNVTLQAPSTVKKVSGLAITGTAKNVTVDGLTINIAKDADKLQLVNIGGVFSEVANENAIDNVEVKNVTIASVDQLDANAGLIAGVLNIMPNSTVNLKISKVSGVNTFTNLGKTMGEKAKLEYYFKSNAYTFAQFNVPYGIVSVNNADFATNGVVNAVLNDNASSENFGRLAAGVVFSFESGEPKDMTTDSTNTEVEWKYNFTSNTKINCSADAAGKYVWRFHNAKRPAAK